MRRGFQNSGFIEENNIFFGVSLGYDYCAEHEWGKLRSSFKISDKGLGFETRKINKADVFFKEFENHAILMSLGYKDVKILENKSFKDLITYDLSKVNLKEEEILTAWDESDFQILVKGEKAVEKLKILYQAFLDLNIIIANLEGGIFSNSSLSLLILNNLPKENLEQIYNVDKKALDLITYEEEIGMTKLKNDKKGGYNQENYFMACSPRWINYKNTEKEKQLKKELNTDYNIVYWINYSDDDNNYGTYTVEEIRKWLSTDGLKLTSIRKAN
jgi:hypothetical protein